MPPKSRSCLEGMVRPRDRGSAVYQRRPKNIIDRMIPALIRRRCPTVLTHGVVSRIGDDQVSQRPIRIFHDEADDQAPFAACRDYIEQLRQAGKDAEITGYPGAHHGYDAVEAGIPRKFHERQNYSRCFVDEANLPPDVTAYLRSCRSTGVTMGHARAPTQMRRSGWRRS
jgi:dienelactone hydrolase